jgi:threonine dehydrogenase-like Zn-dependent dehydrogenase
MGIATMSRQEELLMLPDDEHNRALLENVHPSTWVNPDSAGRYNLVVIGAGTAGLITAVVAAGLGAVSYTHLTLPTKLL